MIQKLKSLSTTASACRMAVVFTGWFGLTLLAQARDAVAAGVALNDLRGYSVDLEYWVTEAYSLSRPGEQTRFIQPSFRYIHRIYVSPRGEIFHRRQFFDERPNYQTPFFTLDNVRNSGDSMLSYLPEQGFVFKNIPSDQKKMTTFVDLVTIPVSRGPEGFKCGVRRSLILEDGAKEFIAYNSPTEKKVISSQSITKSQCRIVPGNVFK